MTSLTTVVTATHHLGMQMKKQSAMAAMLQKQQTTAHAQLLSMQQPMTQQVPLLGGSN
jgi:hypothetical protein